MAAIRSKRGAAGKPLWERAPPAKTKHTHLSPQAKAGAKARARRAGRPYPNAVDNIRATREAEADD